MKKDDIVRMKIKDISSEGLGIGHADGIAVFVKDTVIGDEIEAKIIKMKKTYGFGRLTELLMSSPERTLTRCPVARQCGGCQIQAMSYEAQLQFKQQKVRNNLSRLGGFSEELLDQVMEPVMGMEDPWRYRNKAQFPVGTDRDGKLIAGFYAGRTHRIIDNHDCVLGVEQNQQILELVLAHMRKHHIPAYNEETGKGLIRHVMTRCGSPYGTDHGLSGDQRGTYSGGAETCGNAPADPGDDKHCAEHKQRKYQCDPGAQLPDLVGTGLHRGYDWKCQISDFSAVFLSGQSGADRAALRNSARIC